MHDPRLVARIVFALGQAFEQEGLDPLSRAKRRLHNVSTLTILFLPREDFNDYQAAIHDFAWLTTELIMLRNVNRRLVTPLISAWLVAGSAWPSLVGNCEPSELIREYLVEAQRSTPGNFHHLDWSTVEGWLTAILRTTVACEAYGAIGSNIVHHPDVLSEVEL